MGFPKLLVAALALASGIGTSNLRPASRPRSMAFLSR